MEQVDVPGAGVGPGRRVESALRGPSRGYRTRCGAVAFPNGRGRADQSQLNSATNLTNEWQNARMPAVVFFRERHVISQCGTGEGWSLQIAGAGSRLRGPGSSRREQYSPGVSGNSRGPRVAQEHGASLPDGAGTAPHGGARPGGEISSRPALVRCLR